MKPPVRHSLDSEAINHESCAEPAPVPLTELTSFLGAGKTTLLNYRCKGVIHSVESRERWGS